jgi:hypothetical protein
MQDLVECRETYACGVAVSVAIAVAVGNVLEGVARASSGVGDRADGVGNSRQGVEETGFTLLQDGGELDGVAAASRVAITGRVVVAVAVAGLVVVAVVILVVQSVNACYKNMDLNVRRCRWRCP